MGAKAQDRKAVAADSDVALNLLIVEESRNEADGYVSALRNAGIAVHPTRVSGPIELADAFAENRPDLVLAACGEDDTDLDQIVKIVGAGDFPAPLLVLTSNLTPALLSKARASGVRDVIEKEPAEKLQLAVSRELQDLLARRALLETKSRLAETESRCTALMQSSRDAIAYVHEGMHISANPVYLDMFGLVDMADLEGLSVLDLVDPADHGKLKKILRSLASEADTADVTVTCASSNGARFAAKLEFSPASIDGEPCKQIVIRDQSSDRELERKIQLLTKLDPLTGLANRDHLIDRIDSDLTSARTGTLLYFVVDNFQDLRSSAGLAASDAVLKELAEAVGAEVKEPDLAARFGDHSFSVWLPSADQAAGEALAERLRKLAEEHAYASTKQFVTTTCSVGIAPVAGDTVSAQELANRAYQASETARKAGGNRWKVFDAKDRGIQAAASADETRMHELIAHALEQDRFRLVYQPIVSLQGESRENYGVMVRLLDKNDEEILPAHFFDQAKASDQMAAIDRWVIGHAIRELALQRKQGNKINFFISLSSAALRDESTLLWIIDSLRLENAKGSWLTFQIADEDLRARIQDAKKLIEGLKKIKCRLAIDHFGVMPKFESLLKHLPVDYVRFDCSFLQGLSTDKRKQQQLLELIRAVRPYEIKTVATCVEDANSLAVLWTSGINYIQGYFLQEPTPQIAFEAASQ